MMPEGTILIGSDAPQVFNVPGDALHHEMEIMIDSGLSPPIEVLKVCQLQNPQSFLNKTITAKFNKAFRPIWYY